MKDSNLKLAQNDIDEALKAVEEMEACITIDNDSSKQELKEKFVQLTNKVQRLEDILKSEGINLNECVAFGDALNDLEMLTEVGYGVAMGNSPLILKKKVRYVTDTNENNGVAKFLKKYFFDMDSTINW